MFKSFFLKGILHRFFILNYVMHTSLVPVCALNRSGARDTLIALKGIDSFSSLYNS